MKRRSLFATKWLSNLGRTSLPLCSALLLGAAFAACSSGATPGTSTSTSGSDQGGAGGSATPGPIDGLMAITIDPPSVSVDLPYGKSAGASFQATGHFQDGTVRIVNDEIGWTVSVTSATVAAGNVQITAPGEITVSAASGTIAASATVKVKLSGDVMLPGAPADGGAALGGAPQAGSAPTIAYPLDGALFPSNLGSVELQIDKGSPAQSVGRIDIQGDLVDLHLVGGCDPIPGSQGCSMQIPDDLAPLLAGASEAPTLTTRVRLAAPDGGSLGESAPIDIRWAGVALSGGLYYWRATNDSTAIYRYDLDQPKSAPELFWSSKQSPPLPDNGDPHPCLGCHALAQGGDKIALTFGGSDPSSFALVDVASGKTIAVRNTDAGGFATMTSFSPDGSNLLNAFRGKFTLRTADAQLATVKDNLFAGVGEPVTHPFWSPDGSHFAFVGWQPGQNGAGDSKNGDLVRGGEIFVADAMGETLGDKATLVVPREPNKTHYYPAISDDGSFLIFNTSSCDGPPGNADYGHDPCDGYDDVSARLQLVPVSGGPAVDLAKANGDSTWANSWPRWSPTHDTFRGQSIYWVAFSSRRPYGLRIAGSKDGSSKPQLWFAAVTLTPDSAPAADPSFAPVWMPQQNDDNAHPTGNHIPQWAAKALPVPK